MQRLAWQLCDEDRLLTWDLRVRSVCAYMKSVYRVKWRGGGSQTGSLRTLAQALMHGTSQYRLVLRRMIALSV
jgi:hypothetical protein